MWTFTTIREHAARSGNGAARMVTVVQRQPSWVTKATVGAAMLVLAGVVLLLVIPATLAAAAVFGVLALGNAATRSMRAKLGFGGSGGRRNVRVVTRR
jgi:hypothetical protein